MNETDDVRDRKVRSYDFSMGNVFGDDDDRSSKIARVFNSPSLSVLVVDDSPLQRKLALRSLGGQIDNMMWMIDTAETGERAMQLVQNSPRPPDVIIIDQNMESAGGRLLGHQVVEQLRKNIYFRSVVIIGCTGFFEAAEKHFINAGCDAVWSKPLPSKEIVQSQIHEFILSKKKLIQQQWYTKQNLLTDNTVDMTPNDDEADNTNDNMNISNDNAKHVSNVSIPFSPVSFTFRMPTMKTESKYAFHSYNSNNSTSDSYSIEQCPLHSNNTTSSTNTIITDEQESYEGNHNIVSAVEGGFVHSHNIPAINTNINESGQDCEKSPVFQQIRDFNAPLSVPSWSNVQYNPLAYLLTSDTANSTNTANTANDCSGGNGGSGASTNLSVLTEGIHEIQINGADGNNDVTMAVGSTLV